MPPVAVGSAPSCFAPRCRTASTSSLKIVDEVSLRVWHAPTKLWPIITRRRGQVLHMTQACRRPAGQAFRRAFSEFSGCDTSQQQAIGQSAVGDLLMSAVRKIVAVGSAGS